MSVLFTVQQATDSFATAGSAVAAFGLVSLTTPSKARLVDRYSQRRVLPPLAALCGSGLAATAFTRTPNAAVLVLLVGLTGVSAGPSGRGVGRPRVDRTTPFHGFLAAGLLLLAVAPVSFVSGTSTFSTVSTAGRVSFGRRAASPSRRRSRCSP